VVSAPGTLIVSVMPKAALESTSQALPEQVPAPLLSRILESMRPEQVWLFGSRARGSARPGSDWDLLVVLPDDATEEELDLMLAWQRVRDLRIPADVYPVRRSEFEGARHHAGTLVRTVVTEGRQIYGR
jgi:uncharacterized protein